MKRFQKALLGVVVSGALLFSAQAVGITNTSDTANDILQSALSTVQQEWNTSGKIETTYFPNEYGFVHIIDLLPEKNLYTVNFSFNDGVFSYKFGILNAQTGKLIVPVEYDSAYMLGDKVLVGKVNASHECDYWYADETGKLTPMPIPSGYWFESYEPNNDVYVLSKSVKKPVYEPYSADGPVTLIEDLTFFALADKDMNIILDDIDNMPSPTYHNGVFVVKIGSTKWERSGKESPYGNGPEGLVDPKTGKFIGKHDFNQIFWYDQHFIGTRNNGTYLLDGKGGETLLPANVKEYSSWAKTEVAAAGEHGLTESFSYPRLDITRENFTMLAMNLYNKIYPNKEIPALETKFTDCSNDPNVNNAAALGIVTGYKDGTFRPYKTISRQEAATMLDRLYAALGGKTDVVSEKAFADDAAIGDWARGSVYAMRQTGIMQGKENNRFCPMDGYTAEQSIVTIERMYQIIK
mgnify:FL=1